MANLTYDVTLRRPLQVALISMPFGALERPSLGLGLLHSAVQQAGHNCHTRYLAFDLADAIGVADYDWVNHELPYTAFVGEWLFSRSLYGPDPDREHGYIRTVLRGRWQLHDNAVARLLQLRERAERFIDDVAADPGWGRFDVVGFTSTFQQNLAGLALAKRLAARSDGPFIVFGGANWEAGMGAELHRLHPFVDACCSGESEICFINLLERLADGHSLLGIPGVTARAYGGESVPADAGVPIGDLDSLPVPDFSDYFAQHELKLPDHPTLLLLETSRGCWWGAHSHCTFCGLNGNSMTYRSKSAERAFDELAGLVERYGRHRVGVVDNILDMRYLKTFLPRLEQEQLGVELFYEVKPTLTNSQVAQLAAAGVSEVQPGIESLDDEILTLLRKGTTGLRNVQLLKWCREHHVNVAWNLLYGVPGERDEMYRAMLADLPALSHLQAPSGCGPIRLDRFSPYHDAPAQYGITGVRSMEPYRYLFPFAEQSLERIAYYFDHDEPPPTPAVIAVIAAVDHWRAASGELHEVISEPDHVVIVDTRQSGVVEHEFSGWRAATYLACDTVQTLEDLADIAGATAAELVGFLNACAANRIMLVRGRSCLALAVRTPARARGEHADRNRRSRRTLDVLALLEVG